MGKIADVSKWQGNIDWDTAKSELDFVILRVQDGTVLDTKLSRNISECERLGIPYYLYGFYRNGGATEANRMVSRAKAAGATKCLGYVLDVEVSGLSKSTIQEAINTLKAAGGKTGLYIAHNYYTTYGADYGQDWTWIPRYSTNKPKYPCDLWQYTSSGSVAGMSGSIDLNVLNGDKTLEWFIGTTDTTPKSASVQLYTPNNTDAQKWAVEWDGDAFALRSLSCGLYLDVVGAGTTSGTAVQVYEGNGTDAQKWKLMQQDGSYAPDYARPVQLVPVANEALRLDVVSGGTASGAGIQVYDANATGAQQWSILDHGDGTWTLINVPSSLALDVVGGGV